jgi:hypothetical protein
MGNCSNWLFKKVSHYKTHKDNIGQVTTFQDILCFPEETEVLKKLRAQGKNDPGYKAKAVSLKNRLECFTPAALLKSKAAGKVTEIERTGIMQLDFDSQAIKEYDIEELKQAVFSLPFVGYCGLSCSGNGFYALALIAESERLTDYAEHCFEVFKLYGVQVDETKGKKVSDLRYISYDDRELIRENPKPLKISRFRRKEGHKNTSGGKTSPLRVDSKEAVVKKHLKELSEVQAGNRWPTVQRVAFTLGGFNDPELLEEIRAAIMDNSEFAGQEEKYLTCANDEWEAGLNKPILTPKDSLYWEEDLIPD